MLAFGIISEVFADKGLARVKFPAFDGMVSQPLPMSVPKSLNDKFSIPFDVNEHVWCLMDENLEYGVIGGAIYSANELPPDEAAAENVHISFVHGLAIDYDRQSKTLSVKGTGNVSVDVIGTVNIKAPVINLDAPAVNITGLLTAGGIATAAPSGGNTGNIDVTGNLNVTGDVKSGAISLKTHKHSGVQTGGGASGTPIP